MDCLHSLPTCSTCFVDNHLRCPLHWAEHFKTDIGFFIRVDISELGHVLTLGHNGDQCPSVTYNGNSSSKSMTLMDVNGIHLTKVMFCDCESPCKDCFDQLLEAQMLPATTMQPETAFTFECLEDFMQHSLTSKKSAQDYLWAKRRQTNPLAPHTVKVRASTTCILLHWIYFDH